MSSYYNLNRRADLKITTIDGKRCTAVPRALAIPSTPTTTTRVPAAAPAIESDAPTVPTSTAKSDGNTLVAITTTPLSPVASPANPLNTASSSRPNSFLVTIPTPEAISDTRPTDPGPAPPETTVTSSGTDDEVDNQTPAKSPTGLIGSTPSSPTDNPGATDNASLTPGSNRRSNTGAMVGGVLGTLVLLAIIGILLFSCRRRGRRRRHKGSGSLLSPLGSADREKFYEIDRGSVGPTKRSARWKQEVSTRAESAASDLKATVAGFGTSLKATVSRDRSDPSPVDLDPGKAEKFHHASFNHHHRNEPSVLSTSTERSSVRERLAGWRRRFAEVWASQRQGNEMRGPVSHIGAMPDSIVQLSGDRYRDSDQSGSTATRDLGLSLMDSQTSDLLKLENQPQDPFADPYADPFSDPEQGSLTRTRTVDRPLNDPFVASDGDPFSDQVITNPASIVPRPQTYIQHVRRSRGSVSPMSSNRSSRNSDLISLIDRPSSIAVSSRAPSLIEDPGDRDTIYSSVSADRRGKGRSDPFDLERPELWILPAQSSGTRRT